MELEGPVPSPSSSSLKALGQSTQHSASQESHEIRLRYKLALPTFKTLCTISISPTRQDVLKKACFATEFRSFPIKRTEKAFLREINDNTAIPYHVSEAVSQPWHKVFLVIQLNLLRTNWPNKLSAAARKELHAELKQMYALMDQALRCLVDILGERNDGRGVTVALDVLRSVKAGVWEGDEKQLLQVEGIGLAKMDRLRNAGIKTIRQLSKLDFFHIERLLSRNPPFGHHLLHQLAGFPVLTLSSEVLGLYTSQKPNTSTSHTQDGLGGNDPSTSPAQTWIVRVVLGFQNQELPSWNKSKLWVTFHIEGDDGRLVWFWRGSIKRLLGGKEIVIGLGTRKGEILKITFACEEIVGTVLRETLQV